MSLLDTHADRLDWQEDGTVIFTLLKPIATDKGERATLTVKRPRLQHMLDNEKGGGDDFMKTAMTVASLCGVTFAELDAAHGGDTMVLAEVMSRMMEYGEEDHLLERHADRLTVTSFDAALVLREPLMTTSGEIEDLVVRHPTLKEVRTNQGTTLAASIKLLAILTGHGPNVLGRLDAVDGMILAEQVNDFLGKPRRQSAGAR